MKTKHTPGPWSVHILGQESERPGIEADGISIVIYGVRDEDSQGIHGETYEQEMANARLIAASPELLEALEYYHRFITDTLGYNDDDPMIGSAKAAIAKAKGETR